MDILYDWQFWSVVVSLLAIVSGFVIYLLQRNTKRLVYSILTETPLLSIDEEIKGKIKIKYGNKNIQNIYLVVLKIENKGSVDIASADYEQPILFSFKDSEILSAETIDVSPKNLNPKVINDISKLTIDPILLNKKDYIVIKLLFSKYQNTVDAAARIIGVKEVERIYEKENPAIIRAMTSFWLGAGILTFTFLLLSLIKFPGFTNPNDIIDYGAITAILFAVVFYFRYLLKK